jgi:hypothetical protein
MSSGWIVCYILLLNALAACINKGSAVAAGNLNDKVWLKLAHD